MYDDNGVTPNAFQKGQYEFLNCTANQQNGVLNIQLNSEVGENYLTNDRHLKLVIHQLKKKPENVSIEGRPMDFYWQSNDQTLIIPIELTGNSLLNLNIEL